MPKLQQKFTKKKLIKNQKQNTQWMQIRKWFTSNPIVLCTENAWQNVFLSEVQAFIRIFISMGLQTDIYRCLVAKF